MYSRQCLDEIWNRMATIRTIPLEVWQISPPHERHIQQRGLHSPIVLFRESILIGLIVAKMMFVGVNY